MPSENVHRKPGKILDRSGLHLEEHDHEDTILAMMGAFEQEFHGIKFHIPDNSYYETVDGLSWGVNPTYAHEWNASGEIEIKLRSEERRVGKECRARGVTDQLRKN